MDLTAHTVKRLPAMQETWVRSLGQEDPLEEEMATHSSVLAWRIPWTEEPGRLQSMGLLRVGHDWTTSLSFYTTKYWNILNIDKVIWWNWDFPGGSDNKEFTCRAEDLSSIPGSGRSPGEGNGHPLQYSGLENPMGRGAWWAAVHGFTKSQTWLEWLTKSSGADERKEWGTSEWNRKQRSTGSSNMTGAPENCT